MSFIRDTKPAGWFSRAGTQRPASPDRVHSTNPILAHEHVGEPTASVQEKVELRGLEPLTPTLPVWCATSCATAPHGFSRLRQPPTGKVYTARRGPLPRLPEPRVQGSASLVQRGIGWEECHRRKQSLLPPQHHRPQIIGLLHERITGQRVADEPGALGDL